MSEIPTTVANDELLHRTIDPRGNAVAGDGKVHYMAFYSSADPWHISVDRAAYRSAEDSLKDWPGSRLGQLLTEAVRTLDCNPSPDVLHHPERGNEAHAHITVDAKISKNQVKTKVCAKLAAITTLV